MRCQQFHHRKMGVVARLSLSKAAEWHPPKFVGLSLGFDKLSRAPTYSYSR